MKRGHVPPARHARPALSSSHSRWPLHSCWFARHACPATPARLPWAYDLTGSRDVASLIHNILFRENVLNGTKHIK